MAVTINWGTKEISIQQSDLAPLGGGRYELDVNSLRLTLRSLEDDEAGIVFPHTHNHNTATTLSGVTYARTVEIVNGYTINFEDTGSPYMVVCEGANHNIGDVKTVDHVSLLIGNSAGLVEVGSGGGSSAADIWTYEIDGKQAKERLKTAEKKAKLASIKP